MNESKETKKSQKNCLELKQGEKAPSNGVLISVQKYNWYEEIANEIRPFAKNTNFEQGAVNSD